MYGVLSNYFYIEFPLNSLSLTDKSQRRKESNSNSFARLEITSDKIMTNNSRVSQLNNSLRYP